MTNDESNPSLNAELIGEVDLDKNYSLIPYLRKGLFILNKDEKLFIYYLIKNGGLKWEH